MTAEELIPGPRLVRLAADRAPTATALAPAAASTRISGDTASTRRLACALVGVPEALPPSALDDALLDRARAARAAGCDGAAAAFDAAERYVARFLDSAPQSETGRPAGVQASRQQLLAAAVRQVRRAHQLLADAPLGLLLPAPTEPPDPMLVEHPAALIEDLRALRGWSGLTPGAIAAAARRHGLAVTESQLLGTLEGRTFPSANVTEAIARGCGLSEQQCCAWLMARHRAARTYLVTRPLAPQPSRQGRADAPRTDVPARLDPAALNPQDAQTPVQLCALLIELKARRGLTYGQIQHVANHAGHPVSWSRLQAVVSRPAFPTPRTLEAFVIGCGVDPVELEEWLLARKRLAAGRRRKPRTVHVQTVRVPRGPDAPPDPRGARDWAQFAVALAALVHWSGGDLVAIARRAIESGVPVTTDALQYVLAHRTLPGPSTLNAFVIGCGLPAREQFNWRMARARLAALSSDTQLLPPRGVGPPVFERSARGTIGPSGTRSMGVC